MQRIQVFPLDKSTLFRVANAFAPFAALGGTFSFVAVVIFGFGKGESWMTDFYWYYAGGVCFQNGSNMYDVGCFGPILQKLTGIQALAGLPYPPHFAPFAVGIAFPSISLSSHLFFSASIIISFAMAFVVVETERKVRAREMDDVPLSHLWALLIVLGSSGVWGAVWLGQISLLIALLVWIAFRQIHLGNTVAAGVLLAIISVKPQMASLLFLWVLLHGRFRVLIVAAVVAALMSSYVFVEMGIVPAINGWLSALATYQQYPMNALGGETIMGLPSLLALYGIAIPLPLATAIGALALCYLRFRSKVPPFSPIALSTILLVQMMVFSRPVDTILIAPAFALFWPSERSHPYHLIFFLFTIAMFCFPQQLVMRMFPFPEASHFRTLLITVLTILFGRQMLLGAIRFEFRKADQ